MCNQIIILYPINKYNYYVSTKNFYKNLPDTLDDALIGQTWAPCSYFHSLKLKKKKTKNSVPQLH